jgi:hypothetical protein
MSGDTHGRSRSWLEYFGWTRREATGKPTTSAPEDAGAGTVARPRKTYREALLGSAHSALHEDDAALLQETYFFV